MFPSECHPVDLQHPSQSTCQPGVVVCVESHALLNSYICNYSWGKRKFWERSWKRLDSLGICFLSLTPAWTQKAKVCSQIWCARVRRTSRLSGGDQTCTIFTSSFLLPRNQGVCAGRELLVDLWCWEAVSALVSCRGRVLQFGDTFTPAVWRATGTGAGCLQPRAGLLWAPCPSGRLRQQLLLQRQSWSLNTVPVLETLKFSGLLVCLVVAEYISPVCRFPRGSLLLIVPAPISLPILINLCQVKPQITCQINDWVSLAFSWAFSKNGYQLPWVDYQSGLDYRGCTLCFFCHCE